MGTFALILVVLGVVFGALSVFRVPGNVSWSGLGVICLGAAMLVGRFG